MYILIDQIGSGGMDKMESNIEDHVSDDHRYRAYMGALDNAGQRVESIDLTGERLIEDGIVGYRSIFLHDGERVFAAVVDKDTNKHWMVVTNASSTFGVAFIRLNLTEDYAHLPLPAFLNETSEPYHSYKLLGEEWADTYAWEKEADNEDNEEE